jgi:glutaredoxin
VKARGESHKELSNANFRQVAHVEVFTGNSCSYCHRAKALLTRKGVEYSGEFNIAETANRTALGERLPSARTIPQISSEVATLEVSMT